MQFKKDDLKRKHYQDMKKDKSLKQRLNNI